ncbi:MAG TPA: ZIP family metal transporter [Candidatus Limnocylindrales bacterium]|nr:ZIP family metal transporter [Candidatus Limnocylindrales bacterium]
MTFEQTVLLSAIAGATILLGLPVGRLRNLSSRTQALLTAGAAGVILFLIWDVLGQAIEPVESAIEASADGSGAAADFVVDALGLAVSLAAGLLSIVWLTKRIRAGRGDGTGPREIALGTAIGLGLHNLSEGLAIGQSAATGATAFALILVVGFALHNATEGFGIAAPLTSGERPTWAFLVGLGVIGGGPTFLGGVLGYTFVSPLLSIVFLGLAAGALVYVFNEMMATTRRFSEPLMANVALLVGFFVALATDLLLVAIGA